MKRLSALQLELDLLSIFDFLSEQKAECPLMLAIIEERILEIQRTGTSWPIRKKFF